jgi:hypothetical protein
MPPEVGVMVEFRHADTDEVLWIAPMHHYPATDTLVGWAKTDGPPIWYEVQSVRIMYWEPHTSPGGPGPLTLHCQGYPIVYVREE